MLRRTIVENIDFRKLSNFRFRPGIILSFQKFRIWQYCPKRDCPKREEIHWISFELDSNSQPKSFIWIRKVCSQSKQCFKVLHHFGLTIFFSTFWVDFQTILRLISSKTNYNAKHSFNWTDFRMLKKESLTTSYTATLESIIETVKKYS